MQIQRLKTQQLGWGLLLQCLISPAFDWYLLPYHMLVKVQHLLTIPQSTEVMRAYHSVPQI